MQLMTLDEKIGQMVLYSSDWDIPGTTLKKGYIEDIRNGSCGNILNAHTVAYTLKLQRIAVEESRLHIPLLFGYDVIHGHKTIFPISLGESSSWDLEAIETFRGLWCTACGSRLQYGEYVTTCFSGYLPPTL